MRILIVCKTKSGRRDRLRETKPPFSNSSTFLSFCRAWPDRNYSCLCVRLSVFWEFYFALFWSQEISSWHSGHLQRPLQDLTEKRVILGSGFVICMLTFYFHVRCTDIQNRCSDNSVINTQISTLIVLKQPLQLSPAPPTITCTFDWSRLIQQQVISCYL